MTRITSATGVTRVNFMISSRREVENRLLGVETNITNWQRRQNANNNFSAVVPYDMELQRKESKEFLDDLTTRDQRMMFAVITLAITADTKEQLDSDTEAVLSVARKHMCQLATLKFQQLDGLNTALPIGARKINAFRTLTTESLAVFIPFKVQEIQDKGGIYFGENAISHNLIMCNKANLLNQSAFLLGVPGAGYVFRDPHGCGRQRPPERHVYGRGLRRAESHRGKIPVHHVPHRADRQDRCGAAA